MLIRKMKPEDVPQAAEIEQECFSQPWSEKVYHETLENSASCYLVAETEDNLQDGGIHKIIGTCGFMNVLGEADVSNVAVKKDYRGSGIAYAMMLELIYAGKMAGVETFFLEVRASNTPAIRTYEKCGFQTKGIRRAFYEQPPEDALIMRLESDQTEKTEINRS